jgi:hypothetical protein
LFVCLFHESISSPSSSPPHFSIAWKQGKYFVLAEPSAADGAFNVTLECTKGEIQETTYTTGVFLHFNVYLSGMAASDFGFLDRSAAIQEAFAAYASTDVSSVTIESIANDNSGNVRVAVRIYFETVAAANSWYDTLSGAQQEQDDLQAAMNTKLAATEFGGTVTVESMDSERVSDAATSGARGMMEEAWIVGWVAVGGWVLQQLW